MSKNECIFTVFDSADDAATLIYEYFIGRGYKLESGDIKNGTYGSGNRILRIILGAFAKRYLFSILVIDNGDHQSSVTLSKGMYGALGGVIGVMMQNNEFRKIQADFTGVFPKSEISIGV